jgi:hypothetical protein
LFLLSPKQAGQKSGFVLFASLSRNFINHSNRFRNMDVLQLEARSYSKEEYFALPAVRSSGKTRCGRA